MFVFKAHTKPIYSLAFSPDGRYLASAAGDETVHLWDASSKTKIRSHPGSQFYTHIRFSPDSCLLGWVGYGTRVWSIEKPETPLLENRDFANACCFSPDGNVFATHGPEAIRRWDTKTWNPLPGGWGGTRESTGGERFPCDCVAYRPDGKIVACSFGILGKRRYDSIIYLFDATTGKETSSLRTDFANPHPTAIAFSPDGDYLAGIYGAYLRVWDIKTASEVAVRTVGKKHFKDLLFTPDGQQIVGVNNDETVRVWGSPTWNEVRGFNWKIGKLGSLAITPDGCCIAAGGSTGKVVIWDNV
jgi:WD40 repeat protein